MSPDPRLHLDRRRGSARPPVSRRQPCRRRLRRRVGRQRHRDRVLLAQDTFDLVVVDVNADTLSLLDRVRGGGLDRVALDLPMFVLTSNTAGHHRIRLLERGADEGRLKPFGYLGL